QHPEVTPARGHAAEAFFRDSSLISTSVRMVHLQRTSDEKRPGQGRQRINPREFATTGPKNTGNRSQLPVAPWFASRQQWRSVRSLEKRLFDPFSGHFTPI